MEREKNRCPQCGRTFPNKQELRNHISVEHRAPTLGGRPVESFGKQGGNVRERDEDYQPEEKEETWDEAEGENEDEDWDVDEGEDLDEE